jgi:hypothetical protein
LIKNPPTKQENIPMINSFDDFCLYVFCIVDDIIKQFAPYLKRPGPEPICSDSELMAMCLIGECKGWDMETHRALFPHIPTQSRFNRRRRNLMFTFNSIRQILLSWTDLSHDPHCVIDSMPIPVVQFHLAPSSTGDWRAFGANFGKVASKKQTIFGYKLHLLVTLSGLILDFTLAPASLQDLAVGVDLLTDHNDRLVFGDKAYVSAPAAAELWQQNRIRLETLPRRNQKIQMPSITHKLINQVRQMIETVNAQLESQFKIETNHAHTFWGLCTRLYSKLTAHTLCIFINRLLGKADSLQIKALAFPN